MKWLLVLLGVVVFALSPVAIVADSSSFNVNVVAVPYVGGGIIGFTATYVNETQVDLTWTRGADVTNVMVRMKQGEIPTSRTDGYLVYQGALETFTDTGVNFDENLGVVYYRAWAQNSGGVWDDATINTDNVEGVVILLIGLIALAIITFATGLIVKKPLLAMVAAGLWIVGGIDAYGISAKNWNAWDIYLAIAFLGAFMTIVSVLSIIGMGEKAKALEDVLSPTETEQYWRERDEMAQAFNIFSKPQRKPKQPTINV